MLELKGIEAIVFDLGGVIIDLDFQRSFDRFAQLSGKSPEDIRMGILESDLLQVYEKGLYSDRDFLYRVRTIFDLRCSDDDIEQAFLALLLHIPPERIRLLRALAPHYRLFILSNTSSLHFKAVNAILERDTGVPHLNQLVEKVFLSYEMGLLKPHPEIYQAVLDEAGVKAEQTLFLDDNEQNLSGARLAGIRTTHVHPERCLLTLFHEFLD